MDRFLPLMVVGLLTACGDTAVPETTPLRDPAIMGALSEPLLSDPDLVAASHNGTILSDGGPAEGGVPLFGRDDQEAARARDEAARQLGGAIAAAPRPATGPEVLAIAEAATAGGVAAALPFAAKCAASLDYSFVWAARLPSAVPIYPRAHVQEAAGSDAGGCRLRVVNFRTPVTVSDVVDYYHASATRSGLLPRVSKAGKDVVVSGANGGLSFAIYARQEPGGLTEVDLVTEG